MSCGGAVLAVLLHHLVADGTAQSQFVKAWSEMARGEEISAYPHLDRSRMQARTPPNPSFVHNEYVVLNQAPSFSKEDMAKLILAMPLMTSRIFEFLAEVRMLTTYQIRVFALDGLSSKGKSHDFIVEYITFNTKAAI